MRKFCVIWFMRREKKKLKFTASRQMAGKTFFSLSLFLPNHLLTIRLSSTTTSLRAMKNSYASSTNIKPKAIVTSTCARAITIYMTITSYSLLRGKEKLFYKVPNFTQKLSIRPLISNLCSNLFLYWRSVWREEQSFFFRWVQHPHLWWF